ncbi:MAG: hypothetical protein QXO86_05235 [Nitrososphaerota archaeon]
MGQKGQGEMDVEDIEIDSADTRGKVSTFTGSFHLRGRRYRFTGIAVMTVGGPTVGVSLQGQDESELLSQGLTKEQIDQLLAEVQRKIVEGGFRVSGEIKFSED